MREYLNTHKYFVLFLCALVGLSALGFIITNDTDIMPDTSVTGEIEVPQSPQESDREERGHAVYITGAVQTPGLYIAEQGDTVGELIKNAGGYLPYADTESVNLADSVEGGMHIHVRFNFSGNPEALLRTQKININEATVNELDSLPGIGPTMAKRIDEYRQTKGPFKSIDEIKQVKGIGDGLFKKISSKITV